MGIVGNKGGVAIKLTLNGRSVCFINSHLSAHQCKVGARCARTCAHIRTCRVDMGVDSTHNTHARTHVERIRVGSRQCVDPVGRVVSKADGDA